MKILVCTDGSKHSQKALEKTLELTEGCKSVSDLAVIYVYDGRHDSTLPSLAGAESFTFEQVQNYKTMLDVHKKEKKKILASAVKFFKEKNVKARSIFLEGHPAHMIVRTAKEQNFDLIVIASEGLSGIERLLIGSVSNAVIQEAKDCSVLLVK
ncbi:MAG: universal stress protein [Atribacterota bacterium]|nr:universal stress protein [Atribacterota bacterium]